MMNGITENIPGQLADASYIRKVLNLLFDSGDVVELRCLKTSQATISGYFNDLEKPASEAARLSGHVPAVYVTLNPVTPSLLARSVNRAQGYAKETTGDKQIVKRRWFMLDFDPKRPSGISSTDAEHQAAIDRATEVKKWLEIELEFPPFVIADSGNGAHLLGRIDLPCTDEFTILLKKSIDAVAFRFDDDSIDIDRTVYNTARIWKLYGTRACKGDSTAERPHRLAKILNAPRPVNIIPLERLEQLAAMLPEEPKREASTVNRHSFDVDTWIAQSGLDIANKGNWNGGRKWIPALCPWNSDHDNRSAYIIEQASGAIVAGCHHNGCNDRNWHDLRDVVEPGWREKHGDISRGSDKQQESSEEKKSSNPWARVKSAPQLLAEADLEIKGVAKDLIIPGALTLVAAPRGLGKSLVAQAAAVAITTGGDFRGESVSPLRVLIVDRDNPKSVVKKRLRSWGAELAEKLSTLTREDAPDLKDKTAWESFPVKDYDIIIIDSVGSSTEGITEKEGKETTQVLATLLDLAHKGVAVLLLSNCTKDALNMKGRGEWSDRVDVVYEVRDATDFTPSGKKPWWQELPEAGESAWAERAARRRNRSDYRLAFIPSKFRLGAEPEPFCLQINLPKEIRWTLKDVTSDVLQSGKDAIEAEQKRKEEKLSTAATALKDAVESAKEPILKTPAVDFLHEFGINRVLARELIENNNNQLWRLEPAPGNKIRLVTLSAASSGGSADPHPGSVRHGIELADHAQSGRQTPPLSNSTPGAALNNTDSLPPKEVTSEKQVGKQASNGLDEHGFDWTRGEQKDEPDDKGWEDRRYENRSNRPS